ncbi:helix-turn-helix transcriptional regulator [Papillibacter cinnamivorans]|uniref:AraC-type DNA-binding protein n=1 Tax=Papillibacter cinnamivorans DSM 12816 TaxID=1122930 RepID=A0A1W1ZM67_9FIRM|nr:helix-turn-helix transcriptional regulator [Papillibacter cinnamivorans]SMC49519.1 AraC-type DNA-binding protein [Papillibacter cinnamivorans DSM 12816]
MLESVMQSIAFIESNLHNDIGVCDVANAVSYSQFYFSREFSKHTHISVYDYILRRKISESYKDLFNKKIKIVDLAFRYGFQSHEVYTRAFRKVFGENPSEATVYKPLAVYEPIDEPYLNFLSGLRVEIIDKLSEDCFFEVNRVSSVSEVNSGGSYLILLSKKNLFNLNCVFQGNPSRSENEILSFRLSPLRQKFRIYHTDAKLAFRYFIDYFYDVDEMSSNFFMIQKEEDHIDILVPYVSLLS